MAHNFLKEMQEARETGNWTIADTLVKKVMNLADIEEETSDKDITSGEEIANRRNGAGNMGKKIV
jgi:hypothetical protein